MVELKNNITTVRVSFHALQKQYTVTELPVSVPLGLKRYGLSEIINHLLELDPIVPFDIFVNGKYLNSTLASAIEEHGLSTETVITLKFCEAFRAPSAKFQASVSDWVSSIAFLSSNLCIAGLYDSTVEIWDTNTNVLVHKSSFHTNCIKSVALISSDANKYICITSSLDQLATIFEYDALTQVVSPLYILSGHVASVEDVAVNPRKTHVVTSSWDLSLRLWDSSFEEEKYESYAAKRSHAKIPSSCPERESIALYEGHSGAVTGCLWTDESSFASCSWDHSIRLWDVEAATSTQILVGPTALNDLAASPDSRLFATASSDSTVRVWDPRAQGSVIALTLPAGHTSLVTCVSWDPAKCNQFVSGSYDRKINVWDLRSSLPLHQMNEHSDDVLCVVCSDDGIIASGSKDQTIVFRK